MLIKHYFVRIVLFSLYIVVLDVGDLCPFNNNIFSALSFDLSRLSLSTGFSVIIFERDLQIAAHNMNSKYKPYINYDGSTIVTFNIYISIIHACLY